METKYCKHCGELINKEAVVCVKCGLQVEELKSSYSPQVVINNTNTNTNPNGRRVRGTYRKNKWVALALCIFLGFLGGHKFYEGKSLLAVLYISTCGLFGFGIIVDIFSLLFKPTIYYV